MGTETLKMRIQRLNRAANAALLAAKSREEWNAYAALVAEEYAAREEQAAETAACLARFKEPEPTYDLFGEITSGRPSRW